MTSHTFPDEAQLGALAAAAGDEAPVVMLNLNRYRDLAAYGDERDDAGLTGREAYARYGAVALGAVDALGGRVLWSTETAGAPVIGCDHDAYDEVVAVWYPSRSAFLALTDQPGYSDALEHRDAALDQAVVIPCSAPAEPRLGTPWDG